MCDIPGYTVGCDFSGTVVEDDTKTFAKGARVAGFSHGVNSNNPDSGSHGEYCITRADLIFRVPDNVGLEEAATWGVGCITTGQGLYQTMDLPLPTQPTKEKTPLLIYGGSTATGIFAIQFAKLSGLTVITTCSPRNFDFVKSLGADAVFDYKDPEACAKNIREYTNNSLLYAYDTIGSESAVQICANSLTSASGGKFVTISPKADEKYFHRDDVALKTWTLGYSVMGEAFEWPFKSGNVMPAKPQDFEFGKKFIGICEQLIAERKIKGYPTLKEGGLSAVLEGLEDLKENRVSGQKLVYKVA